jgi:cytochrome b6-f complex iron-sulfur subunit
MSEEIISKLPQGSTPKNESGEPIERRAFLKIAASAVGACYAAAIGYPVYRYLASPVETASLAAAVNEVTLPDAIKLPLNAAMIFKFGVKPAILIHHPDNSWTALTAVCTHLGCTVGYEPSRQVIYCPCHGGTYNATTGANISGPPPKPLTEFKVAITNGQIVVSRT